MTMRHLLYYYASLVDVFVRFLSSLVVFRSQVFSRLSIHMRSALFFACAVAFAVAVTPTKAAAAALRHAHTYGYRLPNFFLSRDRVPMLPGIPPPAEVRTLTGGPTSCWPGDPTEEPPAPW